MARNNEAALAARQRKQKIIVAVGFVIFLALAAIQGPKLMKQLNPPAASTASTASKGTSSSTSAPAAGDAGTSSGTPVTAATLAATAPKSATTQLAGVIIVREQPAQAGEGQLESFSLFDSKDPFVQQVSPDRLPTPAEIAGTTSKPQPSPSAPKPGSVTTVGPGGIPAAGTGTAAPLPAATMALLRVNGKLQAVELKKRFPSSDKAFVLRSLRPGSATIAVSDGSFAGGSATLTLRLGRPVTLVNTATGVRYVLRLVYVGADAAQVTGFAAK